MEKEIYEDYKYYVKKIYFTTNIYGGKKINQPYFEMQDGTVKKPYYKMRGGINQTVWLTAEELIVEKQEISDRKKKWWKFFSQKVSNK